MAAPVRVTFLGGLGDIGRNCAVLESEGRMVILDCGQMFADDTQPGQRLKLRLGEGRLNVEVKRRYKN